MQITLQQSEIEEALVAYVSSQGINLADANVSVNLTAGRGVNGNTATIDIQKKSNAAPVQEVPSLGTDTEDQPVPVTEDPVNHFAADDEPGDEDDIFAAN